METANKPKYTNRIKAIELRLKRHDGDETFEPDDPVRFRIQRQKAIELLRLMDSADQFKTQFNLLLGVLGQWIRKNQENVQDAYVTMQGELLVFLVVRRDTEYNSEFEDHLTDLEFEVANDTDLNLITLDTLSLPPTSEEALRSFVDESLLLRYVGRERPYSAGKC